jgi:radical SAM protein with 4Fe4S-binding SPASM domain
MECFHLPVLDFTDFNARLRQGRNPLQGGMEITHRCNLRCVHCYCRRDADDREARDAELSYEEICGIVDQIVEEGCLYFQLTGGEPLLRRDFIDIYDYCRDKGLLVILFTNGTLITRRIADHLAERPPLSVEVSLYGATKEVYESVTGVPGSYEKCLTGIQLLVDRGIKLVLKSTMMTLNVGELDALKQFAANLGVDFYFGVLLHPRLSGMDDPYGPYQYRLSLDEMVRVEVSDEERLVAWKAYLDRREGMPYPKTLYKCGAGLHSFFIDVVGNLVMCVEARWPSYDLRQGSFREGWHDFLADIRNWPAPEDNECAHCDIFLLCKQCPGRSQLEYGPDIQSKRVGWICDLAHMRAEAFREKGII